MSADIPALFDLTGLLAVVTGARRGIGMALADALAGAGADIVAVIAQMDAKGGAVAKLVRARGRACTALHADFADRAAVTDLAEQLAARSPAIDILVNNAGTIARAPAAQHTDEDWDHVLHVDLTSQFILARAVVRVMRGRGHGKIIFTASLLSFQGGINVPGYAAAKSGVAGLTRALANEWASRGVNVNATAPGYVATDNTQALRDDPARNAVVLEHSGRRWADPEDLAGARVFLASRASDYVHGAIIPVDGDGSGDDRIVVAAWTPPPAHQRTALPLPQSVSRWVGQPACSRAAVAVQRSSAHAAQLGQAALGFAAALLGPEFRQYVDVSQRQVPASLPRAAERHMAVAEALWPCSERVSGAGKNIESPRAGSPSCIDHLSEVR